MVEDEGYKPHEFAVLYRLNSMSRTIEQGMLNAGMSYQVIGGFSFFDRAEIRDALAMLRFLINTNDGMALSRFINKPSRRIGETSLGKIENFANDQGINLIEAMKRVEEYITSGADRVRVVSGCKEIVEAFNFDYTKLTIGEALGALLQKLRYKEFLESKFEKKELDDRKDNIQELINACALYGEKRGQDIAAYLNNIALQTSSDKKAEENSVSLMSIHASKGLEFPVVFMPCMEEGMMPHKRAVAERDGLEEERRLCYVGMTRAEKNLIISFPAQRMQRYKNGHVSFQNTVPSRFLTEADLMNKVRVIKGDSPRGL
jgi:DNA helicase-2/ATP-dependent DNA helicase PcrA